MPQSLFSYQNYSIIALTEELAKKYIKQIIKALDQIPLVDPHQPA